MNFENESESIKYPSIANEIKSMYALDQAMRIKAESDSEFWDERVDRDHTERMKLIVSEIGWPSISKVGTEISYDAWLLVQHADHDVEFQKYCLELMKQEGDVDVINMAYLEDRIRVNSNELQVYGTQFTQIDNQHVPQPIENEAAVDERRAAIGLSSLAEHIKQMYVKYPLTTDSK